MGIACHVGTVKIVKECFPDYVHIGTVAVGLDLLCEPAVHGHCCAYQRSQDGKGHYQFNHSVSVEDIDVVFGFHLSIQNLKRLRHTSEPFCLNHAFFYVSSSIISTRLTVRTKP